jgi:hypothetical protein
MSAAPTFFEQIEILRRDDHRLYHQSRINQTLHLISALCFLVVYVLIWRWPAEASILGWLGAMVVRQTGHYFFEPLQFDNVNNLSNATKERIKVGFNVYRKTALLAVWAALPVALWFDDTLFGLFAHDPSRAALVHRIGITWLWLAGAGFLGRTVYLVLFRSPLLGAAWFAKILTDPFHNVHIYWRSPIYLLQGQLLEPIAKRQYTEDGKLVDGGEAEPQPAH